MSKKMSRTLLEKIEVLDRVKMEPRGTPLRELARRLGVKKSTLGDIIASEMKLRHTASSLAEGDVGLRKKRDRKGKDPQVEHALLLWFQRASTEGQLLNGPILKAKAESLARDLGKPGFTVTDGWFSRWKARNNIVYRLLPGELKTAAVEGADTSSALLSSYAADDTYNAEETGLYYRAAPDGSLYFHRTVLSGVKRAMDSIALMVCANMTGSDRRKLLVIGKSQCPRCMKGVDLTVLPVIYKANKMAWMTRGIFKDWLMQWDTELVEQGRKILVFMDSAPCHLPIPTLENICLELIPPDTTLIQPMGQGVIRNLKLSYREELRKRPLDAIEGNVISPHATVGEVVRHISLLDAIGMVARAWESMKPKMISDCFAKAGFVTGDAAPCTEAEGRTSAEAEGERQITDQFLDIDADLLCRDPQDHEAIVTEAVAAERLLVENDSDSDSEENEAPSVTAGTALTGLREAESFLLKSGLYGKCSNALHDIVASIRERRHTDLVQSDLREVFNKKV
uniref:Tigger transposable element derived 6-like protein n=1 Tax=Callorhinchus milii TaxID=7868 RepID=K4FUT5_CALMI|nr:tigger transposable element derived 6-like protein [Callorhinchus milii]